MTDSEIIKHLEYCMESECEKCQYQYDMACKEYIFHDCLRLIHNLMDKNKAYKYYYDECLKDLKKANTEIERLKGRKNLLKAEKRSLIKAEAVKEFAEKVKETSLYEFIEEYFENAELCYEARQDQFCKHIDNLVKEMVGEQ